MFRALVCVGLLTLVQLAAPLYVVAADRLVKGGDRIALLGGTYVELSQRYGYIEGLLQTHGPDLNLSVRNLGWSGDDASGLARKVFGDPNQGFARLLVDLDTAAPNLVVVAYGTSEALSGSAAVASFEANLVKLLGEIEKRNARVVMALPYKMYGAKRPDYNASFQAVREIIQRVATERKLPVVDLQPAIVEGDLEDGLQPTANGHYKLARVLVGALLGQEISNDTPVATLQWTAKAGDRGGAVRKNVAVATVPSPTAGDLKVKVVATGLPSGEYVIRSGKHEQTVTDKQLADGLVVPAGSLTAQSAAILDNVSQKDMLFFHRYRPQNETYLFLFRKHEQGNNAKEIPEFDPLLESADRQIRKLAGEEVPVEVVIEAKK